MNQWHVRVYRWSDTQPHTAPASPARSRRPTVGTWVATLKRVTTNPARLSKLTLFTLAGALAGVLGVAARRSVDETLPSAPPSTAPTVTASTTKVISPSMPAAPRPRPTSRRAQSAPVAAASEPSAAPPPDPGLPLALQARWEREADDAAWTRHQEAAAQALLDLFELPAESLLDVRCRTSVCRLEVDADQLGRLATLGEHLKQEQYPVTFSLPNEGGAVVAFVAREGMERELLGERVPEDTPAPGDLQPPPVQTSPAR